MRRREYEEMRRREYEETRIRGDENARIREDGKNQTIISLTSAFFIRSMSAISFLYNTA